MNTHDKGSLMRKIALGLIVCAVIGTEVSYHFTLETRFDAIEEKLQQDGVAMQEMQQSLDAMAASKTETLADLNKRLATLQSSFEPLGKNSKEQADSLDRLRQQLAALQQAQTGQLDAQKKLSDYIAQLEVNAKKSHVEAEARPAPAAPVVTAPASNVNLPVAVPIPPAPSATTSAPAAQPAAPNASVSELLSTPGAVSRDLPALVAPRAQPVDPALLAPAAPKNGMAVVLRPADSAATAESSRAPRALPVGAAFSAKP
jgi:hypothetical protein